MHNITENSTVPLHTAALSLGIPARSETFSEVYGQSRETSAAVGLSDLKAHPLLFPSFPSPLSLHLFSELPG